MKDVRIFLILLNTWMRPQMRRISFLVITIGLIGCKEPKRNLPHSSKHSPYSVDYIGRRYGGGVPDDSTLQLMSFGGGKTATGLEYALVIWKACATGGKLQTCKNQIEFFGLDTEITEGNIRVILDTKFAPQVGLGASLCQTSSGHQVVAWEDLSNRENFKVHSAWDIDEGTMKFISIPTDSVDCGVEERANEGEE